MATSTDRARADRDRRIRNRDTGERLLLAAGATMIVLHLLGWVANHFWPTPFNTPNLLLWQIGCCLFVAQVPYRWARNADERYRRRTGGSQ